MLPSLTFRVTVINWVATVEMKLYIYVCVCKQGTNLWHSCDANLLKHKIKNYQSF